LRRRAPGSALFPYTTLFRSVVAEALAVLDVVCTAVRDRNDVIRFGCGGNVAGSAHAVAAEHCPAERFPLASCDASGLLAALFPGDRKSTRLNSSHVKSSYAV